MATAGKRPSLGKGLASLLPGASRLPSARPDGLTKKKEAPVPSAQALAPRTASSRDRHPGISMCRPDEIQVNPYQPRHQFDEKALQELADSIKANGIIQPLVVRKTDDGYQLIAGERRLRASKLAGMKQVPIVIRQSTDRESLQLALIENVQRQDLNCVEEAKAYALLAEDFKFSQEEISTRVGKDRASVANTLRLLKLPSEIIEDLRQGRLYLGHGKALLSLPEREDQLHVRELILRKKLNVRQAEEEARLFLLSKSESSGRVLKVESRLGGRLKTLSRDLARHWSTRIEIKGNESKGKIVLHYKTREDLDRLISRMQNDK